MTTNEAVVTALEIWIKQAQSSAALITRANFVKRVGQELASAATGWTATLPDDHLRLRIRTELERAQGRVLTKAADTDYEVYVNELGSAEAERLIGLARR